MGDLSKTKENAVLESDKAKAEEALTVVIPDDEMEEEGAITIDEIEKSTLDPREKEMAKKHGLVSDEKKDPETKTDAKPDATKKADEKKPDEKKPAGDVTKFDPTKTMPWLFEGDDIDKEREKIGKFDKNATGLYLEQKKLRYQKQNAEADRDHLAVKLKAAEDEIVKLRVKDGKSDQSKEDKDLLNLLEDEPDKADKPEKPDPEETKKKEAAVIEEKRRQAQILSQRLNEQHAEAVQIYSDFDDVSDLADEVLKAPEKLFSGNPRMVRKVGVLYSQFVQLASSADKIRPGEITAADVAYEIGQLHPNYKKPDSNGKVNADTDGDRNPEKVKKMLENANRRSSASVSGGNGTRVVSVEDITVEQAAKLSQEDFRKIPRQVRERLLGRKP